ncbi:hypothetical protein RPATATE_1165 [Rickettsia parkeri str. Tate's Hell]|uniref:Uncharacterized protein n=1 Tax=Rickettsia parkeri str. Tate's Hell TaxID=1359189 RepID=A0ABR5DN79_RICPA|nr:hypothetical protein [Rickettsia parkeri]KJV93975.1 hypothetical protein RPAGB_1138 [Rickettsia parkeri str. Grand Bay]KJV96658.1 hypothetical protein RPAAT24_1359 [Rickettsia parkeri str. AT\
MAAANYLKKDTRINIRISSSDLMRIKQKAAYEGLPYQILFLVYYINIQQDMVNNTYVII